MILSIAVSFYIPLVHKIYYNSRNGNGVDMRLVPHTESDKRNATTSEKMLWWFHEGKLWR